MEIAGEDVNENVISLPMPVPGFNLVYHVIRQTTTKKASTIFTDAAYMIIFELWRGEL